MEQVGLDAPQEALGARAAGVQIDRHLEPVFEKKLEAHESRQCGRGCEFHEQVQIMGISLTPGGGAEKPQARDTERLQFFLQRADGCEK